MKKSNLLAQLLSAEESSPLSDIQRVLDATDEDRVAAKPLSLDERARYYLRDLLGNRDFTAKEMKWARQCLIEAMSDEIVNEATVDYGDRSSGRKVRDDHPEAIAAALGVAAAHLPREPMYSPLIASQARHFSADVNMPYSAKVVSARFSRLTPLAARDETAPRPRHFPRTKWMVGAGALVSFVLGTVLWFGGVLPINPSGKEGAIIANQTSPRSFGPGPYPNDAVGIGPLEKEREIAQIIEEATTLIASGEIVAARAILKRAADSGNADAALAIAKTYETVTSGVEFIRGNRSGDIDLALDWYGRALDLGSQEAAERIEVLKRNRNKYNVERTNE
jgi:hypothetical protein